MQPLITPCLLCGSEEFHMDDAVRIHNGREQRICARHPRELVERRWGAQVSAEELRRRLGEGRQP